MSIDTLTLISSETRRYLQRYPSRDREDLFQTSILNFIVASGCFTDKGLGYFYRAARNTVLNEISKRDRFKTSALAPDVSVIDDNFILNSIRDDNQSFANLVADGYSKEEIKTILNLTEWEYRNTKNSLKDDLTNVD
jgi:DNA-directed RNA polymerase specialized sigma subunit